MKESVVRSVVDPVLAVQLNRHQDDRKVAKALASVKVEFERLERTDARLCREVFSDMFQALYDSGAVQQRSHASTSEGRPGSSRRGAGRPPPPAIPE